MENNRVNEFIENPKKALFKLTLPILVTMFVQVGYNITDTIFVGRLGAEAIAAITFAFPIFILMISLNAGIGIGMGSKISRELGRNNIKSARSTATHGVILSIFIAFLVFISGTIFIEDIINLLGADEDVKPLAIQYLAILLFAPFFMFPAGIFNQIFNGQGDTKTPMKIIVFALIVNIILDPIFIYTLELGVAGAAYATLSAFGCALITFLYFFIKKSEVQFITKGFKFKIHIIKEILSVGIPATLTMITMSIYLFFINRFMAHFGTDYVATFGIVARLESIAIMPINSISIAIITLTGMFYGAKRLDLLDKITWYALRTATLLSILVGIVFFAIPGILFMIFTNENHIIELGITYMRINVFTFPFMAITAVISRTMQGMGYGFPGMIVNFTRVLFIAVPLSFVFIYFFGFPYTTVPIAGVIGGAIGSIVGIILYKILLKKCKTNC